MKKTLRRLLMTGFALSVLVNLFFVHQVTQAFAADGIFKQVNFQGKLQNTDGTNVTDGNYTVVFTLYDASSAGNNLWDETQTVSTVDGIFRVSLGSVDTTLGNVNFNSDSIYLGIKVGTDAEMTPRIRFTAVPYAFNAQKVNGLTVTNTSDTPFSSTTTLKIGEGKTVSIANGLSFSGTDSTAFVFPSTGGNVVTESFAQTLTNKTIGSTGLTFSGASTDITTGTDEDLTLVANGTGVINLNDSIKTPFTGNNAVIFGTVSTGVLAAATTSTSGLCLISGASATYTPSWGTCSAGGPTAWDDIAVPTANLSLAMSTYTTTFNWATGTSTNNLFSLTTDASANGTGSLLNIQTGASSSVLPLRVRAGSVEALAVIANGNVGIGSATPSTKLDVVGGQLLTFGATNKFQIDATTTDSTLTTGVMDIDVDTAADGAEIMNFTFNAIDDTAADTITGFYTKGFAYDDLDTVYVSNFEFSAQNSAIAAAYIQQLSNINTANNLHPTAFLNILDNENSGTAANGILFTVGAGSAMTDAINASDSEIVNALNIGANNILGTTFIVEGNGNVGIGTTTSNLAKLLIDDGGSASSVDLAKIAPTNGVTTTGVDGMQIDFATAGTTASANNAGLRVNVTSNNSGTTTTLEGISIGNLTSAEANSTETGLKIGTGWDVGIAIESGGLTISGGSFTYTGSARPTKTIVLSPEYAGAVLTASNSANALGSLTSDASPSADLSNFRTYYEWSSSQTALNDYTIAVRVALPKDFGAWATSNAIQINFNTALTTTNSNKLDVLIYNPDVSLSAADQATPVVLSQSNVSTSVKTWKVLTIDDSDLIDGNVALDNANDTAVIYLKMHSKDNNYVQVGDIILNYLAAF